MNHRLADLLLASIHRHGRFDSAPKKLAPFLLAALATTPFLASVACSSSDPLSKPVGPEPTPAPVPTLTPQPRTPDADDAGEPDAALPPSTTLVSNTPGVAVVDESEPAAPNLVLVSSNFTQTPSGEEVLLEWFGSVKNIGTTPVCNLTIRGRFEDVKGYLIVSPALTHVDAALYTAGAASSKLVSCLGAGETAGFYSGGLDLTEFPLSSFARIGTAFTFTAPASGAAPAPDAPTVTAKVTSMQGGDAVTGTLAGGGSAVSGVALTFYPMNAAGLVLGRLVASDPDTLPSGGTGSFATSPLNASFTTYLQSVSFTKAAASPHEDAGADVDAGGR